VRPLLVFAAGELTAASPERLEIAASAVELIHSYSLVHDDLPCMDDDVLRRGRPTCHVEYDEATALLVGDSLQVAGFRTAGARDLGDSLRQLEMVRLLAHASGSCGMAGGQAIDLESVGQSLNQPELELMHALKTGALIRAAVLLGGLCGTTKRWQLPSAKRSIALPSAPACCSRSSTTSWTARPTRQRWARRQARMPPPKSRPTSACWGWNAPVNWLMSSGTRHSTALGHFWRRRSQRLIELTDFITQRKF
jgi:hypothetical protein